MATKFSKVIDIFCIKIQDYKLDNLYKNDENLFDTFMEGLVIQAIPYFDTNLVDLSYEKDEENNEYYFIKDLTNKEISILAMIMNYLWVEREINDLRAMSEKLNTRDFKITNTPQIMKQKIEYANIIKEQYLYEIMQLEAKDINKLSYFGDIK